MTRDAHSAALPIIVRKLLDLGRAPQRRHPILTGNGQPGNSEILTGRAVRVHDRSLFSPPIIKLKKQAPLPQSPFIHTPYYLSPKICTSRIQRILAYRLDCCDGFLADFPEEYLSIVSSYRRSRPIGNSNGATGNRVLSVTEHTGLSPQQ